VTTGIIVFAHGSRVESANQAVRSVAADLKAASGHQHVLAAFLELGSPLLPEAADQLVAAGVGRIVILPYFLTLGLHMERDLPRISADIINKYQGLEVKIAPPLDGHPALVQILAERIDEAS
jgi:sirohydrochlorin ferrochelatase